MTNEIKYYKPCASCNNSECVFHGKGKEYICEDYEPCEDCIDRKALGLTNFEILMCDGDYKKTLEMLLKKIEDAPAVKPKQKVGRWERTDYSPGLCNYHCSECHNISLDIGNYCPNCGAKMEVGA